MSSDFFIRSKVIFSSPGPSPVQEDFVLVNESARVFCVADGFGGGSIGAQASRKASEAVLEFLTHEARDREATLPFVVKSYFSLAGNVLYNALVHANRTLWGMNKGKSATQRAGASMIAGLMDGQLLALASVGAMEAWILRKQKPLVLIQPKTYLRLVDPFQGEVTRKRSSVPLAALGMSEDLTPDMLELLLEKGDWLVMASEGFTHHALEQVLGDLAGTGMGSDSEQVHPSVHSALVQRIEQFKKDENYPANATLLVLQLG